MYPFMGRRFMTAALRALGHRVQVVFKIHKSYPVDTTIHFTASLIHIKIQKEK